MFKPFSPFRSGTARRGAAAAASTTGRGRSRPSTVLHGNPPPWSLSTTRVFRTPDPTWVLDQRVYSPTPPSGVPRRAYEPAKRFSGRPARVVAPPPPGKPLKRLIPAPAGPSRCKTGRAFSFPPPKASRSAFNALSVSRFSTPGEKPDILSAPRSVVRSRP